MDNPANRVHWSKQSTRLTPPFLSFSGFTAALHLTSNTLLILSCCLGDRLSHSAIVNGVRAILCIASSTSRTVTPCLFRAFICHGSKSQETWSPVTGGVVACWDCNSLKPVRHLCFKDDETSCAAVDGGSRKSQTKGQDSPFRTAPNFYTSVEQQPQYWSNGKGEWVPPEWTEKRRPEYEKRCRGI